MLIYLLCAKINPRSNTKVFKISATFDQEDVLLYKVNLEIAGITFNKTSKYKSTVNPKPTY